MPNKYETVIGLEIHAELATKSKLFCSCKTDFGAEPNTQICPICTGMPGVLPVLNKQAVEFAIKTALAMNCEISTFSKFDRKNYFYPDLPKGYQISQFDLPISSNGYVDYKFEGETKRVRIRRIHLEEDAGKLVHEGVGDGSMSYVDFNRASVPLIEIVTEPDMRSPEEAVAFFRAVKEILEYLEVSDCNMEEGSYRCDANISLRPAGSQEFGIRTEIKNQNSFRAVLTALKYEERRQAKLLDKGEKVVQETRLVDVERGITMAMRHKEEANDYRYFPEPDLVPVIPDAEWVRRIAADIPELPAQRRDRFVREYGLPEYDAEILTGSRAIADFFDETAKLSGDPKSASNWIMSDLTSLLNRDGIGIADCKVTPKHLSEMIQLINKGSISTKIAKSVLETMFNTGKSAEEIVREKGLSQISDEDMIAQICEKVIEANPDAAEKVRSGQTKAIGFLVGQVMRETRGKANPQLVNRILRVKLSE